MYRVRFHGRGGQGIKTAGRILGTAFFHAGFEVQDAPMYGAERRGAPVSASVRADRHLIRERGLITHPDLIVVVDETVIAVATAAVLLGVTPQTVVLMNTAIPSEVWRDQLHLAGLLITMAVSDEVAQQAPYAGAACAGAAARLIDGITRECLAHALRDELRDQDEMVITANLAHTLHAYDAVAPHAGTVMPGATSDASAYVSPEWIDLPLEATPRSAPDIRATTTSIQVKTGAWRTVRPVIDPDLCHGCTWVCSTLCPDSAIGVTTKRKPEIDYDHCKGCLICVAVCPHHAISLVPEAKALDRRSG